MNLRLFIALELPPAAKDFLSDSIKAIKDGEGKKWRWEDQAKYHLTLKFLGDCAYELVHSISDALSSFAGAGTFRFSYDRFGMFKDRGTPRIFWAGMRFEEDIISFAGEIDQKMNELNFENEKRRLKPHITLLRIKDFYDTEALTDYDGKKFPGNSFEANSLCLYSSILKLGGSEYKKIFEIKFTN